MSQINLARVVVGGLLAGLIANIGEIVLNTVVVGADLEAAMRARNLPPVDTVMIVWFVVVVFALGITTVWLYAAIRPRFGPGVQTAVIAGVVVWAIGYLFPNIGLTVMQVFPARLEVIATLWGLAEIVVASIAGAWLYTETAG